MGDLWSCLVALAVLCLLAAGGQGSAMAMTAQPFALSNVAPSVVLGVDQEGPRFHGRRVQSVYCLRQSYWWFYRPYTTAPADYPRCEPYFHYLEPAYAPRGARTDPYIK